MAKLYSSLLVLLALAMPLRAAGERLYLGTYTRPGGSEGIYTAVLDPETGALGPVTLAAQAHSPGYVAFSPDRKFLYAVTSDSGGSVAAYTMGADGTLGFLNLVPCGGSGPCHLSVDPAGRTVFVANYGDGSVASFRVRPDGGLGEILSSHKFSGSGPNPARQAAPHAHGIYADAAGRFVYVCDLGTDHVWVFRLDQGSLKTSPPLEGTPPPGTVPPGGGPRHLAFSPDQKTVYVNSEMGRAVTVFKRDPASGALTPVQTLPLVPGGPPGPTITTAEIACHPSGKWVYVSSRGDNILAVFATQPDGTLKLVEDAACGVKTPRGFGIDPTGTWLVCAGQDDGRLTLFHIDQASGRLTPAGSEAIGGSPICVAFVSR